ncbi:serine/threonine-protein kinase [Streptomyces roseicoloratus]|uniref:serine/threonine-protein kinase n=1 Tax=Streptomyces roseicoloratus TaxID=2508722 RepID=UPI001009F9D0|nr:serine/threonine-protein kinase [Streptomyces roseicoloratus]
MVRQLGEGGMGQVWEAQDETLGRPVAVKVISLLAGGGSRGDEARARFLREARITAQRQHPNIVTIHDLGETGAGDSRAPFLVMELVRGTGLDAMLHQGPVSLQDAAQWGAQICEALIDAHEAGIMHRDIKPSNILITSSGSVKLLDFGVARAADPYATSDRLTQTGFVVGTPPYMAPEQARGFPEPSSDLYALGCLLFELITGRLPFHAPDAVGYLSAHLTQDPPTPSSVAPGIPPAWDDLLLRLLHKDPAHRYANAADLSEALRRLDHPSEPSEVETGPPSLDATSGDAGKVEESEVLLQQQMQRAAVAELSWEWGRRSARALCFLAVAAIFLAVRMSWFQASGPGGFVDLGVFPPEDSSRQPSYAAMAGALMVMATTGLIISGPDGAASFRRWRVWSCLFLPVGGVFVAILGELEAQRAAGVDNSAVQDMAGMWIFLGAAGTALVAAITVLVSRRIALAASRT